MSRNSDLPASYWPFYCEENVWHLAGALDRDVDEALVAFVTGTRSRVAMWYQRAAPVPERPILWDYHVFLLQRRGASWFVVDPDSTLPRASEASLHLMASFPPLAAEFARLRPRFRLLEAALYRATLESDRSHMRRPDGRWHKPPPPWPTIAHGRAEGDATASNLARFIDMDGAFAGEVCDLAGLQSRLGTEDRRFPA